MNWITIFKHSNSQPLAFVIALVIAFLVTPIIKERADLLSFRPLEDGRNYSPEQKDKTLKTPRLGGLSILIALAATILFYLVFYGRYTPFGTKHLELEAIIMGSSIIFLFGLLDDLKPLKPQIKLSGQLLAASITFFMGLRIKFLVNPLHYFDASHSAHFKLEYWQSFLLTVIFLVLISNAINLIDGVDGLAVGVCIISSISIWAINLSPILYRPDAASLGAMLAGAGLGFLRYNFNPARIFLGDNGAYLLGFMLACISCLGLTKKVTVVILSPVILLIFALPLLDLVLAVWRRWSQKKEIMKPDSQHIHNQLEDLGLNHKQIAYIIYGLTISLAASGCFFIETAIGFRFLSIVFCVAMIWLIYSFVFNLRKQRISKD